MSRRPETGQVDDSWDELVLGALRDSSNPEEEDPDIFDRDTAIPAMPVEGIPPFRPPSEHRIGSEASLSPSPPDPFGPTDPPPTLSPERVFPEREEPRLPLPPTHGGRQRRGTNPEPALERYVDRVARGQPDPAATLDHRTRFESEEPAGGSPLDLVETYRTTTESLPGQLTESQGAVSTRGSRESGTLQDMQDRYAVGDFTGALVVAESILDSNPDDEDAKRYAQSCREVLTQMYAARIGPMDQVAVVAVPPDQITWLSLDHRAGFLLSLIDGVSSIEEILDISGMTRLDALRIMYTLVQQNVITLGH